MSENMNPERDYSKPVSEEQENLLNEMAVDIINGNKKLARKTLAEFVSRRSVTTTPETFGPLKPDPSHAPYCGKARGRDHCTCPKGNVTLGEAGTKLDANEVLNRVRATTWDDEHDRETFSMSRPAALELLRARLSPEPAAQSYAAALRQWQDECWLPAESARTDKAMARLRELLGAVEPAAPYAGVERDIPTAIATDATNELRKYLDNDGPAKWDAETMGYVHGIIQEHAAGHTASLRRELTRVSQEAWLKHMLQMARDEEVATLRREREEAKKALAETESDLEALAAPCGTIQQRITVEREKYRLACDERDAARTDLAAAVGLLEECFALMQKHEGVNFRTLWQRVDEFLAARKEAPK